MSSPLKVGFETEGHPTPRLDPSTLPHESYSRMVGLSYPLGLCHMKVEHEGTATGSDLNTAGPLSGRAGPPRQLSN